MESLTEAYKAIQDENYQLREYIIGLQSKLIDLQSDVPEVPGGIDVHQTRPHASEIMTATQAHEAATNASNAVDAVGTTTAQPGATATAPASSTSQQAHHAAAVPVNLADQQPDQQMNQLNRIAVAGLGMRRPHHEEAAYLSNVPGNPGNNTNMNAGGMSGPPAHKRPRTDSGDGTGFGSDNQGQNLAA